MRLRTLVQYCIALYITPYPNPQDFRSLGEVFCIPIGSLKIKNYSKLFAMSKRFKKDRHCVPPIFQKSAKVWRYAIAVLFENPSTLRVGDFLGNSAVPYYRYWIPEHATRYTPDCTVFQDRSVASYFEGFDILRDCTVPDERHDVWINFCQPTEKCKMSKHFETRGWITKLAHSDYKTLSALL